jgi:5-amino-6-(5-phosphoribosylamino)uracil reductase
MPRPHVTLILAASADGKIAPAYRGAAHFSSGQDKAHLEEQVALADAVLMGASTVRDYSTAFLVKEKTLCQARKERNQSAQPLTVVCSRSLDLDPRLPFFQQPLSRILLTGNSNPTAEKKFIGLAEIWRCSTNPLNSPDVDFQQALARLFDRGVRRLAALGGGEVAAQLFALGLIDEWWLTLCPLVLGGTTAPSPVQGAGFIVGQNAPQLELLSCRHVGDEMYLHYRVKSLSEYTEF